MNHKILFVDDEENVRGVTGGMKGGVRYEGEITKGGEESM